MKKIVKIVILFSMVLILASCGSGGGSSDSSAKVEPTPVYTGKGTISSPYKVFESGEVPVSEEVWTYMKINHISNKNETYKVVLPVYVTTMYVYDENYVRIPIKYEKNLAMFDVNQSVYIDMYSLIDGFIEIMSIGWDERH